MMFDWINVLKSKLKGLFNERFKEQSETKIFEREVNLKDDDGMFHKIPNLKPIVYFFIYIIYNN